MIKQWTNKSRCEVVALRFLYTGTVVRGNAKCKMLVRKIGCLPLRCTAAIVLIRGGRAGALERQLPDASTLASYTAQFCSGRLKVRIMSAVLWVRFAHDQYSQSEILVRGCILLEPIPLEKTSDNTPLGFTSSLMESLASYQTYWEAEVHCSRKRAMLSLKSSID